MELLKKDNKKIIITIVVALLGLIIIYNLYPLVHPLNHIRTDIDREKLIKKAEDVAHKMNISTKGFCRYIKLYQNKKLIKQLQEKYGLDKTNWPDLSALPVYYYYIRWKKIGKLNLVSDDVPDENLKIWQRADKLTMHFNPQGNLVTLHRNFPDSVQLKGVKKEEAAFIADKFIENFLIKDSLINVFRESIRKVNKSFPDLWKIKNAFFRRVIRKPTIHLLKKSRQIFLKAP